MSGLKDSTFEHSNPIRHATELKQILVSRDSSTEPILVLYTDGGPDHRLTYVSVQLSLLASFIQLDLDFLCAIRTPPHNSWKNPAERIMSILNLVLALLEQGPILKISSKDAITNQRAGKTSA